MKGFVAPESGPTWAERAELDPLQAVLDPADTRGGKNRLIDRLHKLALSRTIGDVRGRAVLDFGCGTGRLADWLDRRGAAVDGVDVTAAMVSAARRNVPSCRFHEIDGSTLPFADGHFDVVVTAYVLQYYVDGDGAIPLELARVLRAGGHLVAIEQVTDGELGRGGALSAYERMFEAAGLDLVDHSMIRVSDSRIMGVVLRAPYGSQLPGVPALITREASSRGDAVSPGEYADVLFRGLKR